MLWLELGVVLVLALIVLVSAIVSFNAAKKVHNKSVQKDVQMSGILSVLAFLFALGIAVMLYWWRPQDHVHVTYT